MKNTKHWTLTGYYFTTIYDKLLDEDLIEIGPNPFLLPIEIFEKILSFASVRTIINFSQICKWANKVFNIKYLINDERFSSKVIEEMDLDDDTFYKFFLTKNKTFVASSILKEMNKQMVFVQKYPGECSVRVPSWALWKFKVLRPSIHRGYDSFTAVNCIPFKSGNLADIIRYFPRLVHIVD